MKSPLFKKQALDALLEVINDQSTPRINIIATRIYHSDGQRLRRTRFHRSRKWSECNDSTRAITAAIEPDQIDTDPDVEFHRQYDFMQMLKKTFRGWTVEILLSFSKCHEFCSFIF